MEKVNVLGVNFSNVTMDQALDYSFNQFFKSESKGHIIVTPNPEIVIKANQESDFSKMINQADLCLPDGIGVVLGAKYLNKSLKEKVGGYSYTMAVLERLAKQKGSVYLFGAGEGVAKKAADKLSTDYPGLEIAGYHSGYYSQEDEIYIVEDIAASEADYLIVCLGAGRQESFMYKYKDQLNVKAMIGNGGAIDTMTGVVKRAPDLWIKLGLEWLYRALDDKKRLQRVRVMIPAYFKLLRQEKKTIRK